MDPTGNSLIKLDIAGLGIGIICDDSIFLEGLNKRYKNFLTVNHCDRLFEIELKHSPGKIVRPELARPFINYSQTGLFSIDTKSCSGEFSLMDWKGLIKINSQAEIKTILNEIEYGLRCLFAFMVFNSGGILLHASGIVIDQTGYLFIGKSGAGKSTIVRNSYDKEILGDDMLAVFPSENGWNVMATPFTNPGLQSVKPKKVHLGNLYYLRKSLSTYSEEISSSEALAELVANVPVIPSISEFTLGVIDRCRQIVHEISCKKLYFLPDRSFLEVI